MSYAHTGTDYTVSPGDVLEDFLDSREISKHDFATRCGRSAKFISEIISGKAPLNEETALQFGIVLNTDPQMWLNLESAYRLKLARHKAEEELKSSKTWLKGFPLRDMQKFGLLKPQDNTVDATRSVLQFFGAASTSALDNVFSRQVETAAAFRRSKSFTAHPQAVMAWLQWGELLARDNPVSEYSHSKFRTALKTIRSLTQASPDVIQERVSALCAEAGVWLFFTPELKGTCLSGATRWLGDSPIIQLSLRHKTDDHLWFTFFHEAGHVLLHGKKALFIDEPKAVHRDEREDEADDFAKDMLIERSYWNEFIEKKDFSADSIKRFADRCGIAPGIVLGRLQFEKFVPFPTKLNFLKQSFVWADAA